MARERAVQIHAVGQRTEISSGYLLSRNLVLACWHGIEQALGNNGRVYVRSFDELTWPHDHPKCEADIVWWNEAVDASLIKLRANHPVHQRQFESKPRFARLTFPQECTGVGFPDVVAVAGSATNNSYDFAGRTQLIMPEERLLTQFGTAFDKGWPGVSGAALLHGRAIVGIVRETFIEAGTGSLKAVPINLIVNAPGFFDSLAGQELQIVIPDLVSFDRSRIVPLACHIDRFDPAKAFTTHFRSKPRWPAIVAVTGAEKQKHRRFIERLATLEMKELANVDTDAKQIFPDLKWPRDRHIQSTKAYQDWLTEAWDELCHGDPELPADPGNFAQCAAGLTKAIEKQTAPYGFWVKVNTNTATAGSGHGAFLDKWAALWTAVESKRPFVIFLCLAEDEPAAEDNRVKKYPWSKLPPVEQSPPWDDVLGRLSAEGHIHGEPDLSLIDIGRDEIMKWVDHVCQRLGRGSTPAYCRDIEDLADSLALRLADYFNMTDFDAHVADFLNARRT